MEKTVELLVKFKVHAREDIPGAVTAVENAVYNINGLMDAEVYGATVDGQPVNDPWE